MAAKPDKEALKKNLFWIMLGVFAAFWVVALAVVKFSYSDAKQKEWEKAEKDIKSALSSGPKTQAFITPWDQHGKDFQKHKDVIWKEGWEQQAGMYVWPEDMKIKPLYPEDALGEGPEDGNNKGAFASTWYKSQFEGLAALAAPADYRGGFDAVVPKQVWDQTRPPTREEIWLAQEAFWVRKEMLLIIQDALNASAVFKDVTKDVAGDKDKLPDGVLARKVFRSAFWELDLLITTNKEGKRVISPDSTIKNVNRTQKVQSLASTLSPKGVPFRLVQPSRAGDPATYIMRIAGEPLAYDASSKLNRTYMVDPVDLQKDFGVQQVLEWEASPIREVVALELARHSHRTITWGFKVNEPLKKLDPEPADETPAGGNPGAMTGGAPMIGGFPMTGGAPMTGGTTGVGGPGGANAAEMTKINKISRLRYMHITPQCRHLPVAMRLVVDQAHLHDLLAAAANSALRIQITQVHINHSPSGRHAAHPAPGTQVGNMAGMFGMAGMMGGAPPGRPVFMPPPVFGAGGGRMGRMGGMAMPAPRPPVGGVGGEAGEDVFGAEPGKDGSTGGKVLDAAQLVDVTIYGIATLYERFPARPATPAKKP